jgi:hypothetical protein
MQSELQGRIGELKEMQRIPEEKNSSLEHEITAKTADLHETQALYAEMCEEFDDVRSRFDRFSSKVCVRVCICV